MPQFLPARATGAALHVLVDALDEVDVGIILLDRDMRVRFLNRCVSEIFGLPAEPLPAHTTYPDLLDRAASRSWVAASAAERAALVEQRVTAVRAGSIAPMHLDLSDGRRLVFACKACPDGGRILTYTDVSAELRPEAMDAMEQINAELRFSNETMEDHAAQLASLAEATDESVRKAEEAKHALEREIVERRELEAQLRRMATTDGLTGALNRAGFLALSQKELERAVDSGRGLALMMLDVDHFKSINDRYGHAGGDLALKHLVAMIGSRTRRSDLLGRLGGEEFAILLPAIAAEDAESLARRLVAHIAVSTVPYGERTISLTVSIGLAMAARTDRAIERIIARADEALYRAKEGGRNRVVTDHRAEAA